VFAYNYCIDPVGSLTRRAVLLHGEYTGYHLLEGNHCEEIHTPITDPIGRPTLEMDIIWGRQGRYNTFYRNRVCEPINIYLNWDGTEPQPSAEPGITVEAGPFAISDQANIIGNVVHNMGQITGGAGNPYGSNWDVDQDSTNMLIEKNAYQSTLYLVTQEPTTTSEDNINTGAKVTAWSGMPASLYYTSRPSWWPGTKEWPCIGPDLDGLSDPGNFVKLPAQDRYEGTIPPVTEKYIYSDIDGFSSVEATLTKESDVPYQADHYKQIIFS
jgi:hypothetical protein